MDVVKHKGTNPHDPIKNEIFVLWRRQYTSRHKKNWPRRLNKISRCLASWDQTTNDKWAILSFAQQNQPTLENAKSCISCSDCSKKLFE